MSKFDSYKDNKSFYQSSAWKKKRAEIKKRDNNECVRCKAEGKTTVYNPNLKNKNGHIKLQMVVHHILPLEDYPNLALIDSNLETLCWSCHEKEHGRSYGYWGTIKPNRFSADERW